MHGSESTRQSTASKLFIVLRHMNMEQDTQVARDVPFEEHPCRLWQAAGKLGRAADAPAPDRQKERRGLRAMPALKCHCQPRAVCLLQSLTGIELLQRCRRDAPGANTSCTAQAQTHKSRVLLLRAACSSMSFECHQQKSSCPSHGGGDSGWKGQQLACEIMAVLATTKTSTK